MKKIKQFFEEEMSGEPLTQEKVEWALEKFGRLAWTDGYMGRFMEGFGGIDRDSVEEFLNKDYSERDQEMVNI